MHSKIQSLNDFKNIFKVQILNLNIFSTKSPKSVSVGLGTITRQNPNLACDDLFVGTDIFSAL